MSQVKICGNSSVQDIELARLSGADYAGVIAHPDYERGDTVNSDTAACLMEAIRELPTPLKSVLLPRVSTAPGILQLVSDTKPDMVQIGTVEDPELVADIKAEKPDLPVIQVIHVDNASAIERTARFTGVADMILFDSVGDNPGGNGVTHDWSITAEAVKLVEGAEKKALLAGGLNVNNIGKAIRIARPDAVDVQSGIKAVDGTNDPELTIDFVRAAHFSFQRLRVAESMNPRADDPLLLEAREKQYETL